MYVLSDAFTLIMYPDEVIKESLVSAKCSGA
jgi:hypothetical protein